MWNDCPHITSLERIETKQRPSMWACLLLQSYVLSGWVLKPFWTAAAGFSTGLTDHTVILATSSMHRRECMMNYLMKINTAKLVMHRTTVKLWIEAPGFYQYKLFWPPACIWGPSIYAGPSFYQNILKSVIFYGWCVSIWQLLYKVNVAWNNCFRKIFNACYI